MAKYIKFEIRRARVCVWCGCVHFEFSEACVCNEGLFTKKFLNFSHKIGSQELLDLPYRVAELTEHLLCVCSNMFNSHKKKISRHKMQSNRTPLSLCSVERVSEKQRPLVFRVGRPQDSS